VKFYSDGKREVGSSELTPNPSPNPMNPLGPRLRERGGSQGNDLM